MLKDSTASWALFTIAIRALLSLAGAGGTSVLLRGGTAPSRNTRHGYIRLRVEGLGPSQQIQMKLPIWKCQSCFLGLRHQSRLLLCIHISVFVLPPQREKEYSYPSLKEIKCCTIQILFQGGNVGFFLYFSCLFSSLYKINIVSSVWTGILCQGNPIYNLGCPLIVNILDWKNGSCFAKGFVLLWSGTALKNIFREKSNFQKTQSSSKCPEQILHMPEDLHIQFTMLRMKNPLTPQKPDTYGKKI